MGERNLEWSVPLQTICIKYLRKWMLKIDQNKLVSVWKYLCTEDWSLNGHDLYESAVLKIDKKNIFTCVFCCWHRNNKNTIEVLHQLCDSTLNVWWLWAWCLLSHLLQLSDNLLYSLIAILQYWAKNRFQPQIGLILRLHLQIKRTDWFVLTSSNQTNLLFVTICFVIVKVRKIWSYP